MAMLAAQTAWTMGSSEMIHMGMFRETTTGSRTYELYFTN
jgi:hypothetical protein